MTSGRVKVVVTGLAAMGLAAADAAPPKPVVAPPPVMVVPVAPPAPPAPPAPAPVNFGPAPKAAPWPSNFPAGSKEAKDQAKDLRKQRQQSTPACANREPIKAWMAKTMIAACDKVLGLPDDPEAGWVARGELLHYRAVALINAGDYTNALGALDEADALAKAAPDPLFDLSTGIGNKLLRAFILGRQRKGAEAKALLTEVRKLRPWSTSIIMTADAIEMSLAPADTALPLQLMAGRFRIDPDVARSLIYLYVMNGDLKSAAAMGERVSLVDPQLRGGWSLGGADSEEESVRDRVRMDCTKAYVAAALGNKAAAAAQFEAVARYLDGYVGTDPRLAGDKKKPSKGDIRKYEARLAIGTKQRELLAEWQDVAAKRENLPERSADALFARFKTYKHSVDVLPALVEQIRHMATLVPAAEGARLKTEADGLVRVLTGRMSALSAENLGGMMPKPERLDHVPKFASTASKWLFSDGSGYSQAKEAGSDVRTVRYETLVGSRALVEEMLLLAAANYARQEGKDAFVILSNRTLQRRTTMVGWGGGNTFDSGFEAQARIMLVNANALPPEFASSADRVITVAEVERDIKPRYDDYIARKAAIAAAKKK
jgi:hypothetical protein